MAVRNPETHEASGHNLTKPNFYQAVDEFEIIRRQLQGTGRGSRMIWDSEAASLDMVARLYRLFGIFMDGALKEYEGGCRDGALSALMRALEIREIVPDEALKGFVRRFKADLRPGRLAPALKKVAPAAARGARRDLRFFEQAPAKLRVVAARIFLQLGGENNAREAGRLFGEAVEIGLGIGRAS